MFQGQGATINDILDQTASLDRNAGRPRPGDRRGHQQPEHRAGHHRQAPEGIRPDGQQVRGADHRTEKPGRSAGRRGRTHQRRRGNAGRPAGRGPAAAAQHRRIPRDVILQPLIDQLDGSTTCWHKLPDAFRTIGRVGGIYGDFFNFYLCDTLVESQRITTRRPGTHRQALWVSRPGGAHRNENADGIQPGPRRADGCRHHGARRRGGPKLHQCPDAVRHSRPTTRNSQTPAASTQATRWKSQGSTSAGALAGDPRRPGPGRDSRWPVKKIGTESRAGDPHRHHPRPQEHRDRTARLKSTLPPNGVLPVGQTTTPYQIYDAFVDVTKAASGLGHRRRQTVAECVVGDLRSDLPAPECRPRRGGQVLRHPRQTRRAAQASAGAAPSKVAGVLGDRSEQINSLLVNAKTLLAAFNAAQSGHRRIC